MYMNMSQKELSRGIRKFIRREKSRIRKESLELKERERLIKDLYEKTRVFAKRVKK